MRGEPETVFAVTDYVDGILAGVANYQGSPHAFVLVAQAESRYRLVPLSEDVVSELSASADVWNPTAEIGEAVQAALASLDDGVLVRGKFIPVQPASLAPDLHVKWERDGV